MADKRDPYFCTQLDRPKRWLPSSPDMPGPFRHTTSLAESKTSFDLRDLELEITIRIRFKREREGWYED